LAVLAIIGVVAALSAPTAGAQDKYPSRQIQAIVPFPPGGVIDAAVRILQPPMAAHLGVPIVIVNRAGAGGVTGTAAAASAAPDGYTVLASPSTTITLAGVTNANLPYKLDDFIPVGTYGTDVGVIVVHADSPWKTFEDLIAHARQNPGKLSYASPGAGSVSSFVVKAIAAQHDLQMVEVPFQGSPPANTALLGKQVDLATVAFSTAAPMVEAGTLRALVVSSEQRLPGHPNVPTLAEKGVRNASLGLALGFYFPKGTPNATVELFSGALGVAMKNRSTVESLEKAGLLVKYSGLPDAQRQLQTEHQQVLELGRKLNLVK
jgi:tripartite-type tricarboxylate transporter receptor subunit TctC